MLDRVDRDAQSNTTTPRRARSSAAGSWLRYCAVSLSSRRSWRSRLTSSRDVLKGQFVGSHEKAEGTRTKVDRARPHAGLDATRPHDPALSR